MFLLKLDCMSTRKAKTVTTNVIWLKALALLEFAKPIDTLAASRQAI